MSTTMVTTQRSTSENKVSGRNDTNCRVNAGFQKNGKYLKNNQVIP